MADPKVNVHPELVSQEKGTMSSLETQSSPVQGERRGVGVACSEGQRGNSPSKSMSLKPATDLGIIKQ